MSQVTHPGRLRSVRERGAEGDRRWWILAVLSVAQLMVVLDATVVNIALPSAQAALHFSTADRQWIVTAYSLTFGSLLLLGGRLADLLGRRRMLLIGLAGFAAASALGGAATGFDILVIARATQGAFGAMLAPAALSLLTTTFADSSDRGKAFGIYGAVAGAGGALGLILGGVLTQYLDWRYTLYVNVAFAVIAVTGAAVLLPARGRDRSVHIDIPGTATVIGGLAGLVCGMSEAETRGWTDWLTLSLIATGLALLGLFTVIETRVQHPLLPLRVILDRNRGASYLAILLTGVGTFGIFLFLTYYLQQTLGYTPLKSGLAFLPMIAALIALSTIATGQIAPRVGPRLIVPLGMAVTAVGMVVFAQLTVTSSYTGHVLPGLVIVGAGLGLVFGTAFNTATYGALPADAGVASAMVNVGQQVGGAVGTAMLNTLAASAVASYLSLRAPTALNAARAAVHGDVTAFWVTAAVLLAGAVITALLYRPGRLQAGADAAPTAL
jgi:EmrB/QacA subfamily drug resistance transporter